MPSTSSAVPAEVIARLIEERVWCANEDVDQVASGDTADAQWLHENVLPTLVPAIARMLELANAQMEKSGTSTVTIPTAAQRKDGTVVGPTGRAHPITWLAEYLMRNSARHGSKHLEKHPYVLVEQGKKLQLPSA